MVRNVIYYWIKEQVDQLCPSHITYSVQPYIHYQNLHPKFKKFKQEVDNLSLLFIIPIVIDIHGHRFEIFISVSEIHENVDSVFGIKYIFQLEGIINF